jgi:uncharacterized membrane protein YdbT with pleckstrin-like domain
MSFLESNLLDGEEIIYRAKLHWGIFVRPVGILLICWIVLPILFRILIYTGGGYMMSGIIGGVSSISSIISILAIIYLVYTIIVYKTSEIFLTNKRVFRKTGTFSISTLDIKINIIGTVELSQGIFGKILNYGHIYFLNVGAKTQKIHGIFNPLELRNVIIKQIYQNN